MDKGDKAEHSALLRIRLFLRVYLRDVTRSEPWTAAPEYLSGEGKSGEPQECRTVVNDTVSCSYSDNCFFLSLLSTPFANS